MVAVGIRGIVDLHVDIHLLFKGVEGGDSGWFLIIINILLNGGVQRTMFVTIVLNSVFAYTC